MNSLDELRSTLEQRAGDVGTQVPVERSAAIRDRVRGVRRLRAGAAGSVLAVVLLVVGLATLPRTDAPPQPAGTVGVVGLDVPREVTVLGFEYSYVETITPTFDGARAELEDAVEYGDVVSLVASGLGDGQVTLSQTDDLARALGEQSVGHPVPVDDGSLRLVKQRTPADARIAIARYERTDRMPAGVTNGNVVFRKSLAGDSLITGKLGPATLEGLEITFTGSLSETAIVDHCVAPSGEELWLVAEVDGKPNGGGGCLDDGSTEDAGSTVMYGSGSKPVRSHTVRVWLSRTSGGPPVAEPGASIGVAVYDRAPVETIEYQGRTWVKASEMPNGISVDRTEVTQPESTETRLIRLVDGTGRMRVLSSGGEVLAEGRRLDRGDDGYESFGTTDFVALPGEEYTVELTKLSRSEELDAKVVIYRPID